MPVQQPPITGDPQVDSFNQQVANAINEMPLGNVITTERIVGTDIAGSQGRAGADGFNRATVFIYQRTGINEVNGLTAPDPISNNVSLQYTYDNSSLLANDGNGNFIIGPPWEGWYNYIPERDPVARNDYIWFQAVNIADRGPTDLIDVTNARIRKNVFNILDDYKVDIREHGRLLNYRITDEVTGSSVRDDEWFIAGLQFDIGTGGTR